MNFGVIEVSQYVFMMAISIKVVSYSASAFLFIRSVPLSKIKLFLKLYLNVGTLVPSAWRLASFTTLVISFNALLYYSKTLKDKDIPLLYHQAPYPCLTYGALLTLLLIRATYQSTLEVITIKESIKQFKKLLRAKKALSIVRKTASVLALASPILGLKWTFFSRLGRKVILSRKVTNFAEAWLDKHVKGEVKQYLLAALIASIIEMTYKIGLVIFCFYVTQSPW